MKTEKKRETKLKFDDIPKVGTAGRNILVKALMELDEYKKAMSDGFQGFSEEELKVIEQKYKEGNATGRHTERIKEKKMAIKY